VKVANFVNQFTDGSVVEFNLALQHFLAAQRLLMHGFVFIVDEVFLLELLEVEFVARCA